ncbi:GerAB/ArcD/ProY family transporter [Lentibacillus sp. N15]|uniref:GerAB/ArcD/ProY family transporter n=1 Tax=Lentibacillus songyuanensis TaxID=3136161 RepID=UPI0031BA2497
MDINVNVKDDVRIRAFYLFFIIPGIQIGVGIMGFPTYVYNEAAQDSWISIIIAYLYMMFIVYIMFLILKQYKSADILGIQVDVFGKWIGKLLGTIYMIYFFVGLLTVFVTYIEVVQIFIFPEMSSFVMGGLLLILMIYCILGGLRVIVGAVFLFFFLTMWLLFLLYAPLMNIEFDNFQPFFEASVPSLLHGAKQTAFTFLGFEILFFIYPFIQNKQQAKRPVFLGLSYTAGIVLLDMVIAIGFFSPGLLTQLEWAVLDLFKGIKLPFINRFDFIAIAIWMMVTLSTMLLLLWGIVYGLKRLYNIPQKFTVYAVALLLFIACGFITYHAYVMQLTTAYASVSIWLVYVYPIILLPLVWMKKRWGKKRKGGGKK